MKAVLVRAPGAPIEIADIAVPEPGPGQVRIRVEACGLCHSDLFVAAGKRLPLAPLVLGHEAVGVIDAVGDGVASSRVGSRVGMAFLHRACGDCEYCASGRENFCPRQLQTGYTAQGALAEFALADAAFAAPIPDGLSSAQAAPMCCAGLTAFCAVRTAALTAGEWVAIFGLGGLGHLAIQLAVRAKLRVIAVDVVPQKLEEASRMGAELMINAATEEPREALKRAGIAGAAAAITLTGSVRAIEHAFRTLKPNGLLVLVGLSPDPFSLPVVATVLQGIRIAGMLVGTRQDLRAVLDLAAAGELHAQVETCRLDDAPAVFERMKRGEIAGRAVAVL